ncbi:hypothetical protein PT974_04918 [Cladobotryum mycophilum]|uniref:Zn(2)-C6 fungal-type domain-containing protein n=1 Tax=Cladobotryum mycophilum TaxID=491253 RepID=A0ABR0SQW1_9HYPO
MIMRTTTTAPDQHSAASIPARKRKAHRKSRLGCGNCKIRSVKCDESRPTCRRCEASGFTCNYSHTAPTLQLAHTGAFKLNLSSGHSSYGSGSSCERESIRFEDVKLLWEPVLHTQLRIPVVSPVGGDYVDYALRPTDYAILDRFHKRTLNTFGDAKMRGWYGKAMLDLASSHPFLFHIFIAISLLHDTHLSLSLSTPSTPSHRSSLAFHWYHGAAIFKKLLAQPSPTTTLSSSQRDALWVAASLLGAASFAYVNTIDPRAAWPLKEPEPIDLDWLKLGHGKRVVLEITDPSRPESAFNRIVKDSHSHPPIDGTDAIDPHVLPPLFYSIFDLAPDSSPSTNPYHIPACVLSKLWNEPLNENNVVSYLGFIAQIDIQYRNLVEEKDPRAMLLLLYWHSMVCSRHMWWLRRRSIVEGLAMCIHLEEHCTNEPDIIELIQEPKTKLSMALKSDELYRYVD